jgi:hypothetical protein
MSFVDIQKYNPVQGNLSGRLIISVTIFLRGRRVDAGRPHNLELHIKDNIELARNMTVPFVCINDPVLRHDRSLWHTEAF